MSYEEGNETPEPTIPQDGPTPAPTATMPPPPLPAPPAETKSGRRAFAIVAVIFVAMVGPVILAALLLIGVAIGAAIGIVAEVDVERIDYAPTTVEAIPTEVVVDEAELVIDLSRLSSDDFADRSTPFEIDVDVEIGSVEVIVPEGVTVDVTADNDIGAVEVFDRRVEGIDNRVVHDGGAEADVELNIDVELGDIDVVQG